MSTGKLMHRRSCANMWELTAGVVFALVNMFADGEGVKIFDKQFRTVRV
jgi:hypothetical protein